MTSSDLFQRLQNVCDQLIEMIVPAFGLSGQAVLMEKQGQVVITRSGYQIIKAFSFTDPVANLIEKNVDMFYSKYGDGIKTWCILFANIMKRILENKKNSNIIWQPLVVRGLEHFNRCTLLFIFKNILKTAEIPISKKYICSHEDCICRIVNWFLATRFPKHVHQQLSTLITDFIFRSCDKAYTEQSISYLAENLNAMCIEVYHQAISESHLLSGVVLTKKFIKNHIENVRCIILCDIFNDGGSEKSVYVTNVTQMIATLTEPAHLSQRMTNALKAYNIQIVIAEKSLPKYFLEKCKQHDIVVVQNVLPEEAKLLQHILSLIPVADINDFCASPSLYIGHISSIKSITIGRKSEYTHIIPANKASCCHLIVCGPTKGLCKQYSNAFVEVLRLLKMVYNKDWLENLKNEMVFRNERLSQRTDLELLNKIENDPKDIVNDTSDLESLHSIKVNANSLKTEVTNGVSDTDETNSKQLNEVNCASGLGNLETELKTKTDFSEYLSHNVTIETELVNQLGRNWVICDDCLSHHWVNDVIQKALIDLVILLPPSPKYTLSEMSKVNQSNENVKREKETLKTVKVTETDISNCMNYEGQQVALNFTILSHVIDTLIQIFRITDILLVKRINVPDDQD